MTTKEVFDFLDNLDLKELSDVELYDLNRLAQNFVTFIPLEEQRRKSEEAHIKASTTVMTINHPKSYD